VIPQTAPLDEQTLETFSLIWNTDVKAGLNGVQAALKAPMPPGGRLPLVLNAAARNGGPTTGGNGGAKRAIWFMAHDANARAADFDLWDTTIAELSAALAHAAAACARIEAESEVLVRIEAGHVLDITGGNAEERKARLTLALADDARHSAQTTALREARGQLADADRRIQVARERCRLLRAATAPAE
jgi:hypothetical protein